MQSFILKPWLGIKSNVPPNDPTLFQMVGDNVAIAHCVDGLNLDFQRTRNACSRSFGYADWSKDAVASAAQCLGLFYLDDGTNQNRVYIDGTASGGRIFIYDSSRDPVRYSDVGGDHSGAVEFANSAMDLYSIIRVGSYMVYSDYGEHTPYCWKHGDATLSKLVSADTEYKGKYLEYFANRILMANITSGITVGDISLIWCDINPTPSSSCTFGTGDPPSNHLYEPNDDTITGIKKMGRNSCYLYCENGIDAIDYYANYETPFGLRSIVSGQGAYNNASIVNVGGRHYFFNKNYGFCMFDGSADFPAGGRPISEAIENKVAGINIDYAGWISGVFVPMTNEVAWSVPLDGSAVPTHILYYHILDGTWRIEDKVAYRMDLQSVATDVTWTKLTTELGYSAWEDLGNLRWADLVQTYNRLVFGNTDGELYHRFTEAADGSAMDGYRIEPILDFGRPNDKDLLLEIWFDLADVGDYSMYCYYRGGDTVGETKAAVWTALTEMSCNSPSEAVFRLAESNRYHQIKWGADGADEAFSVSSIEFVYAPEGRY